VSFSSATASSNGPTGVAAILACHAAPRRCLSVWSFGSPFRAPSSAKAATSFLFSSGTRSIKSRSEVNGSCARAATMLWTTATRRPRT
jgi:hypothetical protein